MHMRPATGSFQRSRASSMKRSASAGATPAFCGSSPVFTWISTRGRRLRIHDLRQRFGKARAVEQLDDIEEPDRIRRLVGLQGPDQMERDIGVTGLDLRPFGLGLLDAVFGEETLPGGDRLGDGGGPLRLGDGDEGDSRGIAPGARGGGGDAGAHRRQIGPDVRYRDRLAHA